MKKLVVMSALVIGVAYSIHLYFKFDLGKMPDVPDDGFVLLVGGVKGIMSGVEDVRPERKYRGALRTDLPEWYSEAWSFCYSPTANEPFKDHDWGAGARLEAVCYVDVDSERTTVGYIISVPNL